MKRLNRIISSVVLVCFVFNTTVSDYAFALGTMPGSTQAPTRAAMYDQAQGLLTAKRGPGAISWDAIDVVRLASGRTDDIKAIAASAQDLPLNWITSPQLSTDIVKSFSDLRYSGLFYGHPEFAEGELEDGVLYKLMEEQGTGKRWVVFNKKFADMFNSLLRHDVGFEYTALDGKKTRYGSLKLYVFNMLATRIKWSCSADFSTLSDATRASEAEKAISDYGDAALRNAALGLMVEVCRKPWAERVFVEIADVLRELADTLEASEKAGQLANIRSGDIRGHEKDFGVAYIDKDAYAGWHHVVCPSGLSLYYNRTTKEINFAAGMRAQAVPITAPATRKTSTKMSESEARSVAEEMIALQEKLTRLKHDLRNCNISLGKLEIRLRNRLARQKEVYEWVLSDRVENEIRHDIDNAETRAERLRGKIASTSRSISSIKRKLRTAGLTVIASPIVEKSDEFGTGEVATLKRKLAKERKSLGDLALGLHRRLGFQKERYEWVLFDGVEDRLNDEIEAKQVSIGRLERQIAALQKQSRTQPGKSYWDALGVIARHKELREHDFTLRQYVKCQHRSYPDHKVSESQARRDLDNLAHKGILDIWANYDLPRRPLGYTVNALFADQIYQLYFDEFRHPGFMNDLIKIITDSSVLAKVRDKLTGKINDPNFLRALSRRIAALEARQTTPAAPDAPAEGTAAKPSAPKETVREAFGVALGLILTGTILLICDLYMGIINDIIIRQVIDFGAPALIAIGSVVGLHSIFGGMLEGQNIYAGTKDEILSAEIARYERLPSYLKDLGVSLVHGRVSKLIALVTHEPFHMITRNEAFAVCGQAVLTALGSSYLAARFGVAPFCYGAGILILLMAADFFWHGIIKPKLASMAAQMISRPASAKPALASQIDELSGTSAGAPYTSKEPDLFQAAAEAIHVVVDWISDVKKLPDGTYEIFTRTPDDYEPVSYGKFRLTEGGKFVAITPVAVATSAENVDANKESAKGSTKVLSRPELIEAIALAKSRSDYPEEVKLYTGKYPLWLGVSLPIGLAPHYTELSGVTNIAAYEHKVYIRCIDKSVENGKPIIHTFKWEVYDRSTEDELPPFVAEQFGFVTAKADYLTSDFTLNLPDRDSLNKLHSRGYGRLLRDSVRLKIPLESDNEVGHEWLLTLYSGYLVRLTVKIDHAAEWDAGEIYIKTPVNNVENEEGLLRVFDELAKDKRLVKLLETFEERLRKAIQSSREDGRKLERERARYLRPWLLSEANRLLREERKQHAQTTTTAGEESVSKYEIETMIAMAEAWREAVSKETIAEVVPMIERKDWPMVASEMVALTSVIFQKREKAQSNMEDHAKLQSICVEILKRGLRDEFMTSGVLNNFAPERKFMVEESFRMGEVLYSGKGVVPVQSGNEELKTTLSRAADIITSHPLISKLKNRTSTEIEEGDKIKERAITVILKDSEGKPALTFLVNELKDSLGAGTRVGYCARVFTPGWGWSEHFGGQGTTPEKLYAVVTEMVNLAIQRQEFKVLLTAASGEAPYTGTLHQSPGAETRGSGAGQVGEGIGDAEEVAQPFRAEFEKITAPKLAEAALLTLNTARVGLRSMTVNGTGDRVSFVVDGMQIAHRFTYALQSGIGLIFYRGNDFTGDWERPAIPMADFMNNVREFLSTLFPGGMAAPASLSAPAPAMSAAERLSALLAGPFDHASLGRIDATVDELLEKEPTEALRILEKGDGKTANCILDRLSVREGYGRISHIDSNLINLRMAAERNPAFGVKGRAEAIGIMMAHLNKDEFCPIKMPNNTDSLDDAVTITGTNVVKITAKATVNLILSRGTPVNTAKPQRTSFLEAHAKASQYFLVTEGELNLLVETKSGVVNLPIRKGEAALVYPGTWHMSVTTSPDTKFIVYNVDIGREEHISEPETSFKCIGSVFEIGAPEVNYTGTLHQSPGAETRGSGAGQVGEGIGDAEKVAQPFRAEFEKITVPELAEAALAVLNILKGKKGLGMNTTPGGKEVKVSFRFLNANLTIILNIIPGDIDGRIWCVDEKGGIAWRHDSVRTASFVTEAMKCAASFVSAAPAPATEAGAVQTASGMSAASDGGERALDPRMKTEDPDVVLVRMIVTVCRNREYLTASQLCGSLAQMGRSATAAIVGGITSAIRDGNWLAVSYLSVALIHLSDSDDVPIITSAIDAAVRICAQNKDAKEALKHICNRASIRSRNFAPAIVGAIRELSLQKEYDTIGSLCASLRNHHAGCFGDVSDGIDASIAAGNWLAVSYLSDFLMDSMLDDDDAQREGVAKVTEILRAAVKTGPAAKDTVLSVARKASIKNREVLAPGVVECVSGLAKSRDYNTAQGVCVSLIAMGEAAIPAINAGIDNDMAADNWLAVSYLANVLRSIQGAKADGRLAGIMSKAFEASATETVRYIASMLGQAGAGRSARAVHTAAGGKRYPFTISRIGPGPQMAPGQAPGTDKYTGTGEGANGAASASAINMEQSGASADKPDAQTSPAAKPVAGESVAAGEDVPSGNVPGTRSRNLILDNYRSRNLIFRLSEELSPDEIEALLGIYGKRDQPSRQPLSHRDEGIVRAYEGLLKEAGYELSHDAAGLPFVKGDGQITEVVAYLSGPTVNFIILARELVNIKAKYPQLKNVRQELLPAVNWLLGSIDYRAAKSVVTVERDDTVNISSSVTGRELFRVSFDSSKSLLSVRFLPTTAVVTTQDISKSEQIVGGLLSSIADVAGWKAERAASEAMYGKANDAERTSQLLARHDIATLCVEMKEIGLEMAAYLGDAEDEAALESGIGEQAFDVAAVKLRERLIERCRVIGRSELAEEVLADDAFVNLPPNLRKLLAHYILAEKAGQALVSATGAGTLRQSSGAETKGSGAGQAAADEMRGDGTGFDSSKGAIREDYGFDRPAVAPAAQTSPAAKPVAGESVVTGEGVPSGNVPGTPLLTVIDEFTAPVAWNEGPGAVKPLTASQLREIYDAVNLFHQDRIEIFIHKAIGISPTMRRAIDDINKNLKAKTADKGGKQAEDIIICHPAFESEEQLARLLKNPARGKRIIITADGVCDADKLIALGDLLKNTRTINVKLPDNYAGLKTNDKTFYQAWAVNLGILGRLIEPNSSIYVRSALANLLKGSIEGDINEYIDNLARPEGQWKSPADRIGYFLGKMVRLSYKIAEDYELLRLRMKAFWTAA